MKIYFIFFEIILSEGIKQFLVDDVGLTSAEKVHGLAKNSSREKIGN